MPQLLDLVVLNRDLPEFSICAGDVGTVVESYGPAFEVEFTNGGGKTRAVVTLNADDVRALGDSDALAVRSVPQSA